MEKLSRCNRRAKRRLEIATKMYELMVKTDTRFHGKGFTKPGALKKW
jgi:hypothetical protein